MVELGPGAIFAGHRIEGVAGRGGMGVVYRATQLALDRTVALKVIAPGLLEDGATRHRFVRESKVAASLDHPNVIPIYYSGEERGIAYIAMRHVAGHDLRSLVRGEGRLAPARAARIVAQVAAGLDAAHAAGLVHRDVKPANVLVTAEDHAYLTDFGLTKHALSVGAATKPGQWVGSLDYVAPEQIRGERVDARADVYALGCVLYFALTGRVPFERQGEEAKLWAHLTQPPPSVDGHAAFDGLIERALAKSAHDRYLSAGDLGRAALAAAAEEPVRERERIVAVGPAAPVESPTITSGRQVNAEAETLRQPTGDTPTLALRPRRRRAAILATLAAAAIGGTIAGILLIDGGDDDPALGARTPRPTATPIARPRAPRVVGTARVGERPNGIAVAGGNVFVASFRRRRMDVLSERTARPRKVRPEIGTGAADLQAASGSVWVVVGRDPRALVRLRAKTGARIGSPIPLSAEPTNVAWGRGSVWVTLRTPVAGGPDTLVRIDPRTGGTLESIPFRDGIAGATFGGGRLWVLHRRKPTLQGLDPATGAVERSVTVGAGAIWVAYGAGSVWTANTVANSVSRLEVKTSRVVTIGVGSNPNRIAVRGREAWVSNFNDHTLSRIDVRTSHLVGEPVPVGTNPYALALTPHRVWVTSVGDDTVREVAY